MHSDGYIQDIIPDLVELGLDGLNSQLFCMDIEAIGQQARGKLTFWGEIDRQHILPSGTLEEVDQAVDRVYQALYANGGVIAQCEFSAGGKPPTISTASTRPGRKNCNSRHPSIPRPLPPLKGRKGRDSEGVCAANRRANPFRIPAPPQNGEGPGVGCATLIFYKRKDRVRLRRARSFLL